ncbi:MAG TPA: alpha/beta hydrolase-fold protein [Flavisolibacter sp.]|jgi:enterochelin esterase-like enzyme|nr:alpha/beta hydrolase-fold protein [Flavisolibacter sp.]
MRIGENDSLVIEQRALGSVFLNRIVIFDLYLPKNVSDPATMSLLLINDGQDLPDMPFAAIVEQLLTSGQILPVLCVGIHASKDRRNEYGTAGVLDYEGRGVTAKAYQQFLLEELIPYIHDSFAIQGFHSKSIAGFSLGGLSALDTVWSHPDVFTRSGVFSGSLWWRTKALDDDYNDATDRIMPQLIRQGEWREGLRFYFTTGSMDETADRNGNGIIDSIDDTLAVIQELKDKGYREPEDIRYINYEEGRHDVATWAKALPAFLLWGWGRERDDE